MSKKLEYKIYEFFKDGFYVYLKEEFINIEELESEIYYTDDFGQYVRFIDDLKESFIDEEYNKRQEDAFYWIEQCVEDWWWYEVDLGEERFDHLTEVRVRCIDKEYDS